MWRCTQASSALGKALFACGTDRPCRSQLYTKRNLPQCPGLRVYKQAGTSSKHAFIPGSPTSLELLTYPSVSTLYQSGDYRSIQYRWLRLSFSVGTRTWGSAYEAALAQLNTVLSARWHRSLPLHIRVESWVFAWVDASPLLHSFHRPCSVLHTKFIFGHIIYYFDLSD